MYLLSRPNLDLCQFQYKVVVFAVNTFLHSCNLKYNKKLQYFNVIGIGDDDELHQGGVLLTDGSSLKFYSLCRVIYVIPIHLAR